MSDKQLKLRAAVVYASDTVRVKQVSLDGDGGMGIAYELGVVDPATKEFKGESRSVKVSSDHMTAEAVRSGSALLLEAFQILVNFGAIPVGDVEDSPPVSAEEVPAVAEEALIKRDLVGQ